MNIHQSTLIVLDEVGRQDAHETGQYDEPGRIAVYDFRERLVEGRTVREIAVVEHPGGDPRGPRRCQAGGLGAIADHCANGDREFGGRHLVYDGAQVAATARYQHHDRQPCLAPGNGVCHIGCAGCGRRLHGTALAG